MREIFDAKRKYRNLYMLKSEDGLGVVFRLIPWGEYKTIQNLLNVFPDVEEDLKDYLFEECVLEYSDEFARYAKGKELSQFDIDLGYLDFDLIYSIIDAGIVDTVYNTIMAYSGANNPDKLMNDLDAIRQEAFMDLPDRMISYICAALKIDKNTLDELSWEQVLNLVAQGELILTGAVPNVPFKLSEGSEHKIDFDQENREYEENY